MNKSKHSVSQTRIKPKLPISSPVNNKGMNKTKQKLSKVEPRSNRIHTLQTKKSIEVPKKNLYITVDHNLKDRSVNKEDNKKGYQTPKFKWEVETQKHTTAAHNFFSFGEDQFAKDHQKRNTKQNDRQKGFLPKIKESRDGRTTQIRKQNLIR